MPTKVSFTLLGLIVLAGVVFGAVRIYSTVTAPHDGWDIFTPVETTTEPLIVEPANLLLRDDRESLEKVVNEARSYGIPWSIWVVSSEEVNSDLSAEEIATLRFEETPVESTEGAEDGLLMTVVVPEDDHTQTEVAFVTGPQFYPKGGITPGRLEEIADVQMAPLIAESAIGDAVIEGATWVEWTQLFQPTPDPPPTSLQDGLRELLDPIGAAGIAALAILVFDSAALITLMTWRATTRPEAPTLNGVTAAAAARGRVDDDVIAGVVLDAVDRGTLVVADGRVTMPIAAATGHQWDTELHAALDTITERGGTPTPERLVRYLEGNGNLRRDIEDELANQEVFHPKSPVYTIWLRWIAATGLLLGLIALVISVIGASAPALAAGLALTLVSLVVLIWNERRGWTTRPGSRAVAQWREQHDAPNDRERVLYETVMAMPAVELFPAYRSPVRHDAQPLVGSLSH